VHAVGGELGGQLPPARVVTDAADEPHLASGAGDGGGHVGSAAAPTPADGRRGVGAGADRGGRPDDDVVDQVPERGDHAAIVPAPVAPTCPVPTSLADVLWARL